MHGASKLTEFKRNVHLEVMCTARFQPYNVPSTIFLALMAQSIFCRVLTMGALNLCILFIMKKEIEGAFTIQMLRHC
jgi:hypothetical protein